MPCLLCAIAAKEKSAEIVYEDASALAFLDIFPKSPGHTLVIPKTHAEILLDLPDAVVGPVFRAVQRVSGLLVSALHSDGLTIGINQGAEAGQAIAHLHIHLIPRYKGDGGGSIHSVVNNPPKETLADIRTKILKSEL